MLVDFWNAAPNYNETPLKVFENDPLKNVRLMKRESL